MDLKLKIERSPGKAWAECLAPHLEAIHWATISAPEELKPAIEDIDCMLRLLRAQVPGGKYDD